MIFFCLVLFVFDEAFESKPFTLDISNDTTAVFFFGVLVKHTFLTPIFTAALTLLS